MVAEGQEEETEAIGVGQGKLRIPEAGTKYDRIV